MAKIIPFPAIRPAKDKVHLVAARSVDSYGKQDLNDKLGSNPFSFLHVINPDFGDGNKTIPQSNERLNKIKNKFLDFVNKKILFQENKSCFYVYQQVKENNTFTGIIGCSSIDDYFSGVIKIHEQTITEREEKLKHYLDVCEFNAEPVLFCYPNDEMIDRITEKVMQTSTEYDFTTTDEIEHKLWVVNNDEDIFQIQERFSKINSIYIADGHHRSSSSALLGKSRREKAINYSCNEAYNFYLGIFFPETQLKIYDFNRVVTDLNGLTKKDFIKKIQQHFIVAPRLDSMHKPDSKHNFSMYLENEWYSLDAKPEIVHNEEPVVSLDSTLLTKHILSPVLNIKDLKTDKRINFISGIKGMEELKKQVDSGLYKVAFALYPVEMQQLKHIADTNNIMPPKTTWVEPKMRSGLLIYSLSE